MTDARPEHLEARLEWEDDWLYLVAGPFKCSVAYYEKCEGGVVEANLSGWMSQCEGERILCRDVDEARRVIVTLWELRHGGPLPTPREVTDG